MTVNLAMVGSKRVVSLVWRVESAEFRLLTDEEALEVEVLLATVPDRVDTSETMIERSYFNSTCGG